MKKLLLLLAMLTLAVGILADDLDALQGKWAVKKTGDRGAFTQQLEFKKNKFIFKILGADDALVFIATADVELKKQGPFNTLRIFGIKAGRTEADLEAVDEERNSIFLLDGGQLFLASNFDKARQEKPSADAYSKVN